MTLPALTDLPQYKGVRLDQSDWTQLLNAVINFLTNGSYDLNINQITAGTYIGVPSSQITGILAGENITLGRAVCIHASDGKLYHAENTTAIGTSNVIGFSIDNYATGSTTIVETALYTGLAGLTTGLAYYVGVAGAITSTLPTVYVAKMGIAINATTLRIETNNQSVTGGLVTLSSNNITTNTGNLLLAPYTGITQVKQIDDNSSNMILKSGLFNAVQSSAVTFLTVATGGLFTGLIIVNHTYSDTYSGSYIYYCGLGAGGTSAITELMSEGSYASDAVTISGSSLKYQANDTVGGNGVRITIIGSGYLVTFSNFTS